MDRINTTNKSTDLFGTGKHGFKDAQFSTSTIATETSDTWLNDTQESLCDAIEDSGQTLVKGNLDQLYNVISKAPEFFLIETPGNIQNIRFINGFFYIVGNTGNIQYSANARTWTTVTPAASFVGQWRDIARDPNTGTFVIVGQNEEIQTAATHADGHIDTTLTVRTPVSPLLGSGSTVLGVSWVDDHSKFFIAYTGGSATGVQTSADGTTWVSSLETGNIISSMNASDSIVAVSGSVQEIQVTINGGTDWTFTQMKQFEGEPIAVNWMTYDTGNDVFVISGLDPFGLDENTWAVGIQTTADFVTYNRIVYNPAPPSTANYINTLHKIGDFYILSGQPEGVQGDFDRYLRISDGAVEWEDIEFNITSSRVAIGAPQDGVGSAEGNGISLYGSNGVSVDVLYMAFSRKTEF